MVEYDTWMKLNNSVLRHMTVLLDEEPEIYVEEKKPEITSEEMDSKESFDKEQLSNQVNTSESDNNEGSDDKEDESDDEKASELKEAE